MPAERFDLLVEFTRDEDPRARATAIAGLAKLRDPRGFAPVLVALFDPVDEVRIAAATALGVFADERAREALVECLGDPCERVGANCAWALGQTPGTRSLTTLFELVVDLERAASLRAAAALALGERAALPGSDLSTSDSLIERARIALLHALADDDAEVRAAAVWSVGRLPADKRAIDVCIALLEDGHSWTVRYAIEALARFGDLAALEPLEELTESEDDQIRELAAQAVEMLLMPPTQPDRASERGTL